MIHIYIRYGLLCAMEDLTEFCGRYWLIYWKRLDFDEIKMSPWFDKENDYVLQIDIDDAEKMSNTFLVLLLLLLLLLLFSYIAKLN